MRNAPITKGKTHDAIKYARETWRNDGAEGETVHLLCDAIEQMESIAGCSWCGQTTANTPEAMTDHLLVCERRKGAHEEVVRRAAAQIEVLIAALARAPCRWPDWPEGVAQECSEGDPCLTHYLLGHPQTPTELPGEGQEGGQRT